MMADDTNEFVDVVPDKLPVHLVPSRDQFLPWHKIRKEYIRQFQWGKLTIDTIKRYWKQQLDRPEVSPFLEDSPDEPPFEIPLHQQFQRPLRCLVIPGDDLLDVRALVRDIEHLNYVVRYLGFNQSHDSNDVGTRVHIANNAVTSHPSVMRDSRVVGDRFEMIARNNSLAERNLREYGPFHVVNLDFCGSLFPNTAKDTQDYYDAIHKLLVYQFASQKSEWLLFMTTEVEPDLVHFGKLQVLCKQMRKNFDSYDDFAESLSNLVPPSSLQRVDQTVNITGLSSDQIVSMFGVALGKWLIKLCQNAHPRWTIAMRQSYKYTINAEKGVVMLALAFALRPNVTPPIDDMGVSTLAVTVKAYPDERDCALKLVKSVAAINDVDVLLEKDDVLKSKLREMQADLLQSAGYDRDAYIAWVNAGEGTTN